MRSATTILGNQAPFSSEWSDHAMGHSVRSRVSSPYTFWLQGGNALTQREKTKKESMREFFGCPWNIPSQRYPVVFVSRTSWVSGFLHCGMEPRWWQRSCRMRPQLFNTRFLWLGPCNTTSTSKSFKNLNNPSWSSLPFDTSFTIMIFWFLESKTT